MAPETLSSMHDARDAEDLRLLANGEHRRLVESYYRVVLDRCRARVWPEEAAIAVAAEVAIRLLSELSRGRTYPVPFRVVVHMVTSWKIKEYFRPSEELPVELADDPVDEDGYRAVESDFDLELLLRALPDREEQVGRLRYLDGFEPAEIAERLGMERNAVDQAHHRLLRRLRERLEA